MTDAVADPSAPAISAAPNGPLLVTGRVPLYRRRDVRSEQGEPLTWETTVQIDTRDRYALCRCGQSSNKPFCDGTHVKVGFTADDTATGTYDDRSTSLGGTGLTVRDDRTICVHAGFCGTRVTNVWKQMADTGDSDVRMQVIRTIEKCPSGALTLRFEDRDTDNEQLLPQSVAVIDDGPLWVTGGVPVTTSTGQAVEVRNRVTLCRCGGSGNKPLCDGSHKAAGFHDH